VFGMPGARLLPLEPRWVLATNEGQYAVVDTTFARVDGLGVYARIARMFTNHDHQDQIDMTSVIWKALALPIVLLGFPALLLVAVGFAALVRRGAGIALVIAASVYLIACGVCGASFVELAQIL